MAARRLWQDAEKVAVACCCHYRAPLRLHYFS